jgi:hypothetical protein
MMNRAMGAVFMAGMVVLVAKGVKEMHPKSDIKDRQKRERKTCFN